MYWKQVWNKSQTYFDGRFNSGAFFIYLTVRPSTDGKRAPLTAINLQAAGSPQQAPPTYIAKMWKLIKFIKNVIFWRNHTDINPDDWTITKKTIRTTIHENFSKMKNSKVDRWALSLTDEVLFQSFWNSTGILLIWRIGGGGALTSNGVCVCVRWCGVGGRTHLHLLVGEEGTCIHIHTYIHWRGGGGTHLWCIYYLVPYSDLGGQGELRRLTSLLYMQQHPQPSGHCGHCLLLVIIVIMCNICKFSNFVSEPMGWQYCHATWF